MVMMGQQHPDLFDVAFTATPQMKDHEREELMKEVTMEPIMPQERCVSSGNLEFSQTMIGASGLWNMLGH